MCQHRAGALQKRVTKSSEGIQRGARQGQAGRDGAAVTFLVPSPCVMTTVTDRSGAGRHSSLSLESPVRGYRVLRHSGNVNSGADSRQGAESCRITLWSPPGPPGSASLILCHIKWQV